MELFKLNDICGQRLGRTVHGQPKFQWCRTDHLFWGSQRHGWATRQLPSGLWIAGPVFSRHTWAEPQLLGPGWSMSKWWPPDCSEQEWHAKYLGQLPYPAGGEYRPIGGMFHETEPTIDDTLRAIWSIKKEIEKGYGEHVADGDRILATRKRRVDSEVSDEIDELLPLHEPGKRGGPRLVFTERKAS